MPAINLAELWNSVQEINVGMFTTSDGQGNLTSRPMLVQKILNDGVLWFFTSLHSKLAEDLKVQPKANISFSEQPETFYVSLTGHAQLIADRTHYNALWNTMAGSWFAQGLDDPQLALIRFQVTSAEYWDSAASSMVELRELVNTAIVHEDPDEIGTHQRMNLGNR